MAAPTNHYKLGLFVLAGFAAAIAITVLLVGVKMHKDVIQCHSYFNESVQGLDVGAPVKFRGVTVGNVAAIEIAPDHRMVDVISELYENDVTLMGLAETDGKLGKSRVVIPPDLRMQLNSQGITGVKFVSLDFFDVKSNPAPVLPFPVPRNHYIPATPSMMKNLENTATKAMERLPEMVDAVVMIMGRVDGLIATLDAEDLPEKAGQTLGHANTLLQKLERTAQHLDDQHLGEKTGALLSEVARTTNRLNAVLDDFDGPNGVLASAKRASDAIGEVGRAGKDTQQDLATALRGVSEAAEAARSLLDAIERDPDMLLKGKSRRGARP
ncbi:MAG TPA: MlaD family protein [Polyangiaceae bacterium]